MCITKETVKHRVHESCWPQLLTSRNHLHILAYTSLTVNYSKSIVNLHTHKSTCFALQIYEVRYIHIFGISSFLCCVRNISIVWG